MSPCRPLCSASSQSYAFVRCVLLPAAILLALLLPGIVRAQAWVDAVRLGTEVRFLYNGTVRRYDLASRTWLTAVTLPRTGATAMACDVTDCYVAYGTAIFRYTTAFTGETSFATAGTSVHGLFVDGNVLLAVHSASTTSRVTSWNRASRTQISTRDTSTWSLFGSSHAPGLNRIFGRSQLVSPSDISYSSYTSDGVISATVDSPHHGDYPDATRTWVSGDEARVFDTSGTVYRTSDLAHVGSVGGAITDVAFNSDVPVVLRGNLLIAFKNTLLEAGRKTLSSSAGAEVQLDTTSAYVFRPASPNPLVEIVALTEINAPPPNQPLDATGLPFSPHTVFRDRDGLINLYSTAYGSFFRWDPEQEIYAAPLTLAAPTAGQTFITYSDSSHRIYMGNLTNIRQMNAVPGAAATTFATPSDVLYGMAMAGDFIYTSYRSGSRCYTSTGTALNEAGEYGGTGNAWDPVRRRMYHFQDELSNPRMVYEVIGTDGRITGSGGWPDSNGYNRSFPIRVSPDGSRVVTGEGVVFGVSGHTIVTDLDVNMTDMLWFNGAFVSIESGGSGVTRLQRWSSSWQRQGAQLFNGSPLRLITLAADRLLLITMSQGIPRYHVIDGEYTHISDSMNSAPAVVTHPVGGEVEYRTSWVFTAEATGSPDLHYQWLKNNQPITGATTPSLILTDLGSGDTAEYRCRVTNSLGMAVSAGALLFVGPVNPPAYTAGNLLVCSDRRVFEYTPAGVLRSSLQVPAPTSNAPSNRVVGDAAVDRFGRLQVLNEGRNAENTAQYFVSTYDPRRGLWYHRPAGNLGFLPDAAQRDMSIAGDLIYLRTWRLNLATSVAEYNYYPSTVSVDEITAGLDGRLYTVNNSTGVVRRLDTNLNVITTWDLGSFLLTGVAGDAAGRFYVGDANGALRSYSSGGSLVRTLTPAGAFNGFTDVSVSSTGQLAAGSLSGLVAVSDTSLSSAISINPGTSSASYTAWITPVTRPQPSLTATPAAPAATEDVPYQWAPAAAHPDPDAVLTFSAPVKPNWLTISGNVFSGTPLQADTGAHPVRLRVTDSTGSFVERDFTINVIEVNDTPTASNQSVTMDEDSAPILLDLTGIFLDEETPATALSWQIVDTTGASVIPAIESTSLRLTFPADANGPASVTVRATDAGGLTADALVSVEVRPVNDPPSFPLPPPVINAGPAAPNAIIDLAAGMRDPDGGDTHTWRITAVSNPDIFSALSIDAAGQLTIQYAPYRSGTSDVTAEVSDAAGTVSTLTFKVTLPELPAPVMTANIPPVLNRQTGLWEHRITLRNDALRDIGGFEVRVSNLPPGACLYNASECSSSVQLAGYYAPIAPGGSITMVLEYYNPARVMPSPQLEMTPVLPRPPVSSAAGGLAIDRISTAGGGLLLEFTAAPNHLYVVQYSEDGAQWRDSLVRIRAAGNRVQWLDQGPPRTQSAPLGGDSQRFYRVKEIVESSGGVSVPAAVR